MGTCDLKLIFGDISEKITATPDDCFTITPEMVPQCPVVINTDRIIIKKYIAHFSGYCETKVDMLDFQAHKDSYRHLGLCLLSCLFHSLPKRVRININHPKSEIKALFFEHKAITPNGVYWFEYSSKLERFEYYLDIPSKHPFSKVKPYSILPGFRLTNEKDLLYSDEDWSNRNFVGGCGPWAECDMLIAKLLIDISQPNVMQNEFVLENGLFGDFARGVRPESPGVRFWLPGSMGWDGDL